MEKTSRFRGGVLDTRCEKYIIKGCEDVIEFDEYKLELDGMKKDITDLRDSL